VRIYTATPLAVLSETDLDYNFFCRDMGLICHGLREQGVESQVVLLDFPGAKKHPDIIRATLQQMVDQQWWKQFNLDAVVLGAWAAPKYTPIAKAIKEAGAKVIVRCDYGDCYSQWQGSLWWPWYRNYLYSRYEGQGFFYACLFSALKTTAFYIPAVYEKKVVEHLSYADLIMNETPESTRFLKAFLSRYRRADLAARVIYVLHPVSGEMGYSGAAEKERRIIAVGRWDHYSKNASLLIKTIRKVLSAHDGYEVHIFGGGGTMLEKELASVPEAVRRRVHIRGKLPNRELVAEYQKSQILFMPSRSEGASVAATEALACGCSIVGRTQIFSMRNFVSKNSGTLARRYSVRGMSEALSIEINTWAEGLRDPAGFAVQWEAEVSQRAIARTIIAAAGR
jgi:glycosyltransferase involved in cell wall biosynthesis